MCPVVTVWYMTGPLLRTRRYRPVFRFWNWSVPVVDPNELIHRWLWKPTPLFAAGSIRTFPPGLKFLVVRASVPGHGPILRTTS